MEKDNKIDRKIVLETLIRHETLTLPDLAKKENIGVVPDIAHLKYLLDELHDSGHLHNLPGVNPLTYTITKKGIEEGVRLRNIEEQPDDRKTAPGGL
jgi:hypothetical protein